MIASAAFAASRAWMLLWRLLLIPPLLLFSQELFVRSNDAVDPVSNWFRPVRIDIPDFCQGGDPNIKYYRWIATPFIGSYATHFTDTVNDAFPLFPYDSADIPYRPRQSIEARPLLSTFMGRSQDLGPGRYYAAVLWTVNRPWHSTAWIELNSNVFVVWPRDSEQCKPEGSLP